MAGLVLREAPFESAEVQTLLAEVQLFYVERYGSQDEAPTDPAEFAAPDGVFWIAALTDADPGVVPQVAQAADPTVADLGVADPTVADLGLAELPANVETVGCVGLRRHDERTAELKRMFLRPAYRGQGLGRVMLLAAERRALELGYRRLILETGHQQPEALALYLSHGFTQTANYGYRRNSLSARSFIKTF